MLRPCYRARVHHATSTLLFHSEVHATVPVRDMCYVNATVPEHDMLRHVPERDTIRRVPEFRCLPRDDSLMSVIR
jgi:hypothetical protein